MEKMLAECLDSLLRYTTIEDQDRGIPIPNAFLFTNAIIVHKGPAEGATPLHARKEGGSPP